MRAIQTSFILFLFVVVLTCSSCGPNTSSKQGIAVAMQQCQGDPNTQYSPTPTCLPGSQLMVIPHVPVWGTYDSDEYDSSGNDLAQGTVTYFGSGTQPLITPSNGALPINNARAPAYWNLFYLSPFYCGTSNFQGGGDWDGTYWDEYEIQNTLVPNYYASGLASTDVCIHYGSLLPASTRFAVLGSLPGTITLGSSVPFSTTNGMPLLYVYDGKENLVTTSTATSVSSDGSEATFPFPSTLAQAGYSLAVVNQIGGNLQYQTAGTNLLSIASSQTIAGTPFGVAAGAQTTTTITCNMISPYPGVQPVRECSSNSNYNSFPVVSLYSLNQVLAGGTAINVGLNPTAVATYQNGYTENTYDNGMMIQIVTGTNRAVVANSGSNTISVLDIVNNVLLSNIPVGNQPVALAVSSDGSTAYVANYTDSTVTQVNLNTGSATATIAVGGHPTSVALTASGTLWAGGQGFLTQMSTQPMSAVATQTIFNKTITALGFSDSENQLIATTVDARSNVYVDEINPGTIHTGSAYTPLASTMVSSLGSHLIRSASIRAFTATLASANLISPNQAGAPPLVVQDGWAVVTATPTGFTITDISGQVVLVSETTPSPVTAIAVDSKFNAAYLVMPDSNTLLTVPLPGVN
ncbi:MAG: hypothetical protein WAN35_09740 [Terracidiphilus sp.]